MTTADTRDLNASLRRVARAVRYAASAKRKRSKAKASLRPLPAKVRRAMQPTKKQRDDFERKFCEAFFHVRYHIQPTGNGFEVWNVVSHKVEATFPTFSRAKAYVGEKS